MSAYIGDDTKPAVNVSSEGSVPTIEVRASQANRTTLFPILRFRGISSKWIRERYTVHLD